MVINFLLKKKINPRLIHQYRISENKTTPPRNHTHSSFLMKLLKAHDNFTTLE
jgi:hypothetical protein